MWQEVPPGVALKAVGASCAAVPARACAWAGAQWAAALRADAAAAQVEVAHSDSVLVNQAPLAPDAAVAVGWRAVAAGHSAAAQLRPDGLAEAAGPDAAALRRLKRPALLRLGILRPRNFGRTVRWNRLRLALLRRWRLKRPVLLRLCILRPRNFSRTVRWNRLRLALLRGWRLNGLVLLRLGILRPWHFTWTVL